MDEPLTLEGLDRDGALGETAAAAREASRRQFFKRGMVLGGAGLAAGSIPVSFALAQNGLPKGDVGNATIRALAKMLPLGTPVDIRRD